MSPTPTLMGTAAADIPARSGSVAFLDTAELAQVAADLVAVTPLATVPAGTARRWVRLHHCERYAAWMIVWPAGTGLAMHDHDGSAAAVAVAAGQLRERFQVADGEVASRTLTAGTIVELPDDHVHEIRNVTNSDAVSVHVYSPPLDTMGFYADATAADLPAA